MPDLKPDTSIFTKPPAPMSIGDMVGTMRGMQAYQKETYEFRKEMFNDAAEAVASTLTDPNASQEKFAATLAPHLAKIGVPPDLINEAASAGPGQSYKDHLVQIQQWIHRNGAIPTVSTVHPVTGKPVAVPPGQIYYGQAGGGGGGPGVTVTAPRAGMTSPAGGGDGGGRPGGGAIGSYDTGLAPTEAATQAGAQTAAQALQQQGPEIARTRSGLQTLDELSTEAASGGGAKFSQSWSKLMNQLGLSELATLTPKQVAAGENFEKIRSRIVAQMQEGDRGHTNAWLDNYNAGNPSLSMSPKGRSGVIHWLQGLNDAENLIYRKWAQFDADPRNRGMQGQFSRWLQSPQGMDIGRYDGRVFQYQRMTPSERKDFRSAMPPKVRKEFEQHYLDYKAKGWIDEAQGK